MKIIRAVNVGEEIFNTYGELGNAKLLCSYGFTQAENPADRVTIGVPALRAAAALCGVSGSQITARLSWCETNGVCNDDTTFHLRAHSDPPDALILVLRILAASDESFDVFRQVSKPTNEGAKIESTAHFAAIVEKQSGMKDERALRILLETLRRRRAMYKSTPEDGQPTWNSNLSVLLESETLILRTCENYLDEYMRREDAATKKQRRCDNTSSEPDDAQRGGGKKPVDDAFSLFD
jgi:SET domain-containing protein 6